jgi:hypothetical protein
MPSSPIYDQLTSEWQLVSRLDGDLQKAFPFYYVVAFAALILGFVWLLLLKYCAVFSSGFHLPHACYVVRQVLCHTVANCYDPETVTLRQAGVLMPINPRA